VRHERHSQLQRRPSQTVKLIGNRTAQWFCICGRHLLQRLVVSQGKGSGDFLLLNGEGTNRQWLERTRVNERERPMLELKLVQFRQLSLQPFV